MLLRRVTHDDRGCASYLVGDDGAATAAVVDPRFEIAVDLDHARYKGVRLDHVLGADRRDEGHPPSSVQNQIER